MAGPTSHPGIVPMHYYSSAVGNTKVEISGTKSNVYGIYVENNSSTDAIFVQIFNKLSADVTLGTTLPDYTFRIPADGALGKDAQDLPIHFHDKGITIAVTSGRSNSTAPASDATVQFWYWNG